MAFTPTADMRSKESTVWLANNSLRARKGPLSGTEICIDLDEIPRSPERPVISTFDHHLDFGGFPTPFLEALTASFATGMNLDIRRRPSESTTNTNYQERTITYMQRFEHFYFPTVLLLLS